MAQNDELAALTWCLTCNRMKEDSGKTGNWLKGADIGILRERSGSVLGREAMIGLRRAATGQGGSHPVGT